MSDYGKNSAELEREVEAQRQRVEDRIGEIRERLSPGQLVDELLSYTKNGGQSFISNLGSTVASNPLPTALLGVSLVWLMSGQGPKLMGGHDNDRDRAASDWRASDSGMDWNEVDADYPYVTVSGGLRRVSHSTDESGDWYSEFEDNSGARYRAKSNQHGHRMGHFMDKTGKKIGGFIDEAGHRIRDFTDEAGNRFSAASGWASHRWHDLTSGIGSAMAGIGSEAQHMGAKATRTAYDARRMATSLYNDQPLVAGALAFAAGAALGAALPRTPAEDRLIGEMGDDVRDRAMDAAADLYETGKAKAAELYEKGKDTAKNLYDEVSAGSSSGTGTMRDNGGARSTDLH